MLDETVNFQYAVSQFMPDVPFSTSSGTTGSSRMDLAQAFPSLSPEEVSYRIVPKDNANIYVFQADTTSNINTTLHVKVEDDDVVQVYAECQCSDCQELTAAFEENGLHTQAPACSHVWSMLFALSDTDFEPPTLSTNYLQLSQSDMQQEDSYKYSFVGDKIIRQLERTADLHGHIYLTGPCGCGKTLLAKEYAEKTDREVIVLSGNRGFTDSAMLGQTVLETDPESMSSRTRFVDGPLTEAFLKAQTEPVVIIVDEISRFEVENQNIFITAFDTAKDGTRTLENRDAPDPEKRRITVPKENLLVIATANVGYAGVRGLDEALMDRFASVIDVQYLPAKAEIDFLQTKFEIDETLAKRSVDFAWMTRKLADGQISGAVPIPDGLSTRALSQISQLINKYGPSPDVIADAFVGQLQKCVMFASRPKVALKGLISELKTFFPECEEELSDKPPEITASKEVQDLRSMNTISSEVLQQIQKDVHKKRSNSKAK